MSQSLDQGFSRARYIWSDAAGTGRNRFVFFRQQFALSGQPQDAVLHLFADTRYRLLVNGEVVGHGPARFHLHAPEYDSWDITRYLQTGENVIGVLVNSIGLQTFSSDKSVGGLIVWAEVQPSAGEATVLATDSLWKVHETSAYRHDTQTLNFALGPFEYLDGRQLPEGWALPDFDASDWQFAIEVSNQNQWGELRPRSIALLDESPVTPTLVSTFATYNSQQNSQFASLRYCTESAGPLSHQPLVVATSIYSPREQTVTLGVSWGRFWLNEVEVKPTPRRDLLWRGDCTVAFKAGWNSWHVFDRMNGGAYEFALQWPAEANIHVDARQQLGAAPRSRLSSAPSETESFLSNIQQGRLPVTGDWVLLNGEAQMPSPYAARAWEQLKPFSEAESQSATGKVFLFDFGTAVLGRPIVEFTAPAGTLVDLHYTERLSEGHADHHTQYIRMAERYLAKEGRQSWRTFHPRGMRYLELIVRGETQNFELHQVGLTRANLPVHNVGRFECSDPLLNRIWQVGRDTLLACMEDGYIDCPWRERGIYTGDVLVQYYSNLATFGDHSLMRRSLKQLFETQDEVNGELAPSSHGLPAGRHPDYSALALQGLWHYWARSGDLSYVAALQPRIHKLLAGLEAIEVPELNLLDVTGREAYVDVSHLDADGINCASNCLHQQAFLHGARLLRLLGEDAEAARWETHAQAVAQAIQSAFWSDEKQAFLDRRLSDVPSAEASGLGNVLPLLYGLASSQQIAPMLQKVKQLAVANRRSDAPLKTGDFNFSPYSSFYLLGALYEQDEAELAEAFIRDNWGAMLAAGAATWWEYFVDDASLCHAWSSCPTHYLSSQVLGVRYATPGEPDEIVIAPQPGHLEWAKGVYPHPRGPIQVEWRRVEGELQLSYDAPEGVRVSIPKQFSSKHTYTQNAS